MKSICIPGTDYLGAPHNFNRKHNMKVKLLSIPNEKLLAASCAEYVYDYGNENNLLADIISAIKQPIAKLIESTVLSDFHEITDEQYDILLRWVNLNNENYCGEHYLLIVDKFSTSKQDFDALLELATNKMKKHDAQIKKENEEKEKARLNLVASAEKKHIKKRKKRSTID